MTDKPLPKEEPPADMRQFASVMRGMYVAFIQEGFTTKEAMGILSSVILANMGGKGT